MKSVKKWSSSGKTFWFLIELIAFSKSSEKSLTKELFRGKITEIVFLFSILCYCFRDL